MTTHESLIKELRAIRGSAAFYNATAFGHLKIEGPDAASYLQRMVTNEVQKMPVGEGRYNALLDRKGMVLSLFYLFRTGETEFLAVTPPQLTQKTAGILTKMKFIQKVTITNESDSRGLLWLIGSSPPQKGGFICWKDDTLGLPVWNISGPREMIQGMVEELSAGAQKLSDEAVRIMKIGASFPEYGTDIDETHILLETNCPHFYQRYKGCYPGQEVIERILAYGKGRTPRSLCRLTLEGEQKIEPKTEIFASTGEKAGFVTSSAYNPLDQKTLVLAYLDHKFVEEAGGLKVEGGIVTLFDKPAG